MANVVASSHKLHLLSTHAGCGHNKCRCRSALGLPNNNQLGAEAEESPPTPSSSSMASTVVLLPVAEIDAGKGQEDGVGRSGEAMLKPAPDEAYKGGR
ncbi:hypothetical protein E2562_021970 [Oryza meyeriana var. granulata]|uniref:Uncharacterized protein n=1 Tax=Oryza meyeriana var. granulata TaxID=110450 RepID=A0A6G1DLN7_9ORYZ|nr:hypothetical protein E2562_021970 [Oryza meyeriana var. granulata]